MSETTAPTKKPFIVYAMAVLFILAPVGNILITFATSSVSDWYQPTVFMGLLQSIPAADRLILVLTALTGIFLLKAHKTSWLLALVILGAVLGLNFFRILYPPEGSVDFSGVQTWLAIGATLAALLVAFYFRFPYLDRRSGWLSSSSRRYDLRTPVQVVVHDIFAGVTESISMSGTRIRLQQDLGPEGGRVKFVDVIFTDIRKIRITCEVVEYADNILRLRFKRLSPKERGYINDWLQYQNETDYEI